jgi:hypothetical protein
MRAAPWSGVDLERAAPFRFDGIKIQVSDATALHAYVHSSRQFDAVDITTLRLRFERAQRLAITSSTEANPPDRTRFSTKSTRSLGSDALTFI